MSAALDAIKQLKTAVVADYDQVRHHRAKYRGESLPADGLRADLIRKVGFQMMAVIRVMKALESARVPLLPQIVSRAIRHLYGAEVHWKAELDPGVSIVHGCGLVISHASKVGSGCILFHNVTLGESVDPDTRQVGSPTLGRNVHVGPGATLLGPITIGDRTKIMAGAVVTRSVPPDSLIKPADPIIAARRSSPAQTPEVAG